MKFKMVLISILTSISTCTFLILTQNNLETEQLKDRLYQSELQNHRQKQLLNQYHGWSKYVCTNYTEELCTQEFSKFKESD